MFTSVCLGSNESVLKTRLQDQYVQGWLNREKNGEGIEIETILENSAEDLRLQFLSPCRYLGRIRFDTSPGQCVE
jgi:hypothetical protein